MRFWPMGVPIPCPRPRAGDRENGENDRRDPARISAFKTTPTVAGPARPTRRLPGDIAEDLSEKSPQECPGGSEPFDRFGERRGSFHRWDTPRHQKSFRRLFLANFLG